MPYCSLRKLSKRWWMNGINLRQLKSLMESHNKRIKRVNWTPECITKGEEGSATLETRTVLTVLLQNIRPLSCSELKITFSTRFPNLNSLQVSPKISPLNIFSLLPFLALSYLASMLTTLHATQAFPCMSESKYRPDQKLVWRRRRS